MPLAGIRAVRRSDVGRGGRLHQACHLLGLKVHEDDCTEVESLRQRLNVALRRTARGSGGFNGRVLRLPGRPSGAECI